MLGTEGGDKVDYTKKNILPPLLQLSDGSNQPTAYFFLFQEPPNAPTPTATHSTPGRAAADSTTSRAMT